MKETENKAKMLNFEKKYQFTKEYSYEPRMVEKWVLWYIWSKKNRYESEKTTIASTTSDFFNGYVKNNSFMSIYIENFAQNS